MKKLNLFLLCGNMVTGKSSLIREIKNHNEKSNKGIVILEEENFYKDFLSKSESIENAISKQLGFEEDIEMKVKNFHFSVQTFMLNNFMTAFKNNAKAFSESEETLILDIISDTFPPITGLIFSEKKNKFNLITQSHFEVLKNAYIHSMFLFSECIKNLREKEIQINIKVFFRIIDSAYSLQLLSERSFEEFEFYKKNDDYFVSLNEGLKNFDLYKSYLDSFPGSDNVTVEYFVQDFRNEKDFDKNNIDVLETLYK